MSWVGGVARHLLASSESEALIKQFRVAAGFELPAAAGRQKTSGFSGRKQHRPSQGINSFTHRCLCYFYFKMSLFVFFNRNDANNVLRVE